ncbi:radical SAM family heme chaperone HemW [Clostridium sediminicola]|uniref:coproporphyrinogen-III oxidase family protein n=1 Tax=Clostridium sediminicola TaxID=3114879 RepID=UPI0031F201FC
MITDLLSRIILGKKDKFIFKGYESRMIDFSRIEEEIGIYIHIPFCKSICPYCPYNKVVYEKNMAEKYVEALLKEFNLYKDEIQNKKITSIYFGGGTPTLVAKELIEFIQYIKKTISFDGDIGMEVYPSQVNTNLLNTLKELGVNMISLGVQTFDDDILKFLGRNYTAKDIDIAIKLIKSYGFKCVDIDIMSNLPGQSIEQIEYDLKKVYSYGIDQLSIYPLIVFPLTNMSKVINDRGLSRFNEFQEINILKLIDAISSEYGYKRNSVWTYGKEDNNRYTSVTRESFIGLGAGASSLFGDYFYLNTFNVDEYIKAVNEKKKPINLVNVMNEKEKMIFWIFWRCYDGVIDENRFKELFGKDMKKEFRLLFTALKFLRMSKQQQNKLVLTNFGRYAYHYVEKQYSIHYLNKLWQSSMEKAWIEEIKI